MPMPALARAAAPRPPSCCGAPSRSRLAPFSYCICRTGFASFLRRSSSGSMPSLLGQLVDGRLERERALRMAGGAQRRGRAGVGEDVVLLDSEVRAVRVERRRGPAGAGAVGDPRGAERAMVRRPSACRRAWRRAGSVISALGALPVQRCSSRRSSISLTGAPACLASLQAITTQRAARGRRAKLAAEAAAHVLDDHVHVLAVEPSASATPLRTVNVPCVEAQTVSWSPSHFAIDAVRLERRVRVHRHVVGGLDPRRPPRPGPSPRRRASRRCLSDLGPDHVAPALRRLRLLLVQLGGQLVQLVDERRVGLHRPPQVGRRRTARHRSPGSAARRPRPAPARWRRRRPRPGRRSGRCATRSSRRPSRPAAPRPARCRSSRSRPRGRPRAPCGPRACRAADVERVLGLAGHLGGPVEPRVPSLDDAQLRVEVPGREVALGELDLERLGLGGEAGLDGVLDGGSRRLSAEPGCAMARPAPSAAFWTASKTRPYVPQRHRLPARPSLICVERRARVAPEQRGGRDHEAGRAEAALQRVALHEGRLQRAQLLGPAQPLDRRDLVPLGVGARASGRSRPARRRAAPCRRRRLRGRRPPWRR